MPKRSKKLPALKACESLWREWRIVHRDPKKVYLHSRAFDNLHDARRELKQWNWLSEQWYKIVRVEIRLATKRKIGRAMMDWAADRIAKQRKIWKRLNVGNDPYSLRFHGGVEMAGSVLQRLVRKEAKKI